VEGGGATCEGGVLEGGRGAHAHMGGGGGMRGDGGGQRHSEGV
jgi:hypothetical protein